MFTRLKNLLNKLDCEIKWKGRFLTITDDKLILIQLLSIVSQDAVCRDHAKELLAFQESNMMTI